MSTTEIGSDEVPLESNFKYYVNMIVYIIVGGTGGCLYLRGADLPSPEIVLPFCFILLFTFLKDMVFVWTTKRSKALCYKNASILMGLLSYFYYNSTLRSLDLNTILACAFIPSIYDVIQRQIHAKSDREERLYNREVFTLNSGSMLAYGFYYGYLKLILPGGGTGDVKGVKEKIEDFINKEEGGNEDFRKMFPVRKLFILIPSSSFSHDRPDFGSGMEAVKPLEEHTQTRALTKERVYKNTVYLVTNKAAKKKYYVLPEIATPTKTLYETCKEQKHVAEYKEEIVISFYHTLQRLLDEDPTCGDVCELIYYKDSGRSRERVNLADVIIKRIEENMRQET